MCHTPYSGLAPPKQYQMSRDGLLECSGARLTMLGLNLPEQRYPVFSVRIYDFIVLKHQIRLVVHHVPVIQISALTSYDSLGWTKLTPFCTVESSPTATVEWYKDGEKITELVREKGRTHVMKKSVKHYMVPLTMGLGRDNDNNTWVFDQNNLGLYECRASNYLGTASAAIQVSKDCKWDDEEFCFNVQN